MVKAGALAIAATVIAASPAQACRLALVLAVDVSSSVDADEDQLQRNGIASALLDPDVEAAFFISPDPVALYVFEWSGRYNQQVLLDWTLIETPNSLLAAAQAVASSTRLHDDFPTAMGYALGFAANQFSNAPSCLSHTIDMAGDGINNDGFGPKEAYAAFPFAGVTVNGLAVIVDNADDALVPYYEENVMRGPGAFVETANGFEDYATAMRRKLLRELTSMMIGDAAPQRNGSAS